MAPIAPAQTGNVSRAARSRAPPIHTQRRRLEGRGDPPERVAARIAEAERERRDALDLGCVLLVNDDLDRVVAEVLAHVAGARRAGGGGDTSGDVAR